MADTHEGFDYEKNSYNALRKYNVTSGSLVRARKDGLDMAIKRSLNKSGLELKNKPTAAGSVVLKYIKDHWTWGEADTEEKKFLIGVGNEIGVLKMMNRYWKKPVLQYSKDGKNKIYIGIPQHAAFDVDRRRFSSHSGTGDIVKEVPSKAICDYYNKKGSYYINIGNRGLFLLGSRDPLGLNAALRKKGMAPIPDFANEATRTVMRVRLQSKGKGHHRYQDYQFAFTLEMSAVNTSPYNLCPIKKGTKSKIDFAELADCPLLEFFDKKD